MRGFTQLKLWHVLQVSFRGYSTPAPQTVDKALLSKLRKQTGVPFINCKKALVKFDNNFDEAKKWLVAEAQKEGWARATKLQTRPMSQGLVAVVADQNQATMIEVNCETDFVARNEQFISMVTKVAQECSSHFGKMPEKQITAGKSALDQIMTSDNQTLADMVALGVGTIGENMALRRGAFMRAEPGTILASYVHPSGGGKSKSILLGKYGAVVHLRQDKSAEKVVMSLSDLGSHLCQHIVGMNPKVIGEYQSPTPISHPLHPAARDVGKIFETREDSGYMSDESSDAERTSLSQEDEDELLKQEFLLDTSMTVGELLIINGAEVLNFKRFACGEDVEGEAQS